MKPKQEDPKEMVGGCCVCSDENGWTENPLVYCDGQGCNVAVHQACYGIVAVPTGAWFCRKCESQERAARVRCELCPSKDGALKRTDSGGWAHVVCALYIPEVRFGNVTTMEPIMLQLIPQERFNKSCYLCEEGNRTSKANIGACMQCNRAGCKNHFHVTCAQGMGLLCEEAGNYLDNVKYCGYCQYHYNKLRRGSHVKSIPPYRPVNNQDTPSSDDDKSGSTSTAEAKFSRLKRRSSKSSPPPDSNKTIGRDNHSDPQGPLNKVSSSDSSVNHLENNKEHNSLNCVVNSVIENNKSESKNSDKIEPSSSSLNVLSVTSSAAVNVKLSNSAGNSDSKSTISSTTISLGVSSASTTVVQNSTSVLPSETVSIGSGSRMPASQSSASDSSTSTAASAIKAENQISGASSTVNLGTKLRIVNSVVSAFPQSTTSSISLSTSMEKDKFRKRGKSSSRFGTASSTLSDPDLLTSTVGDNHTSKEEGVLTICEERNLSMDREKGSHKAQNLPGESRINSHLASTVSNSHKLDFPSKTESPLTEPMKRARSNSQDRGRRSKRGSCTTGGSMSKRGRYAAIPNTREGIKETCSNSEDVSSPESQSIEAALKRGRISKVPEIKDSKEGLTSLITNGVTTNVLLLGNQINPSSSMAQKMTDTLNAELEAHSIYKQEEGSCIPIVGPSLPGKRETSTPGSILNNAIPPPLPQSLEELLERQWEQGSQFLMEQAQHFDIASLLSCLHQLRQENVRLEETVNNLVARRDHLLAVNARLSVPLTTSPTTTTTTTQPTTASPHSSTVISSPLSLGSATSSPQHSAGTSLVFSNAISNSSGGTTGSAGAGPGVGAGQGPQVVHGSGGPLSAVLSASRHHSHQRHPTGVVSSHSGHGSLSNSVNNLGSRGSSPHDRRHGGQGHPIENGLPEPEYRYRSPGTEHQHRQHSPMLPPGAQPSPNSMRQSPAASSNYHSNSSPHSVVPSLSPSGGSNHPPSHTLVAHVPSHSVGHGPHGSAHHTVALSRVTPDHSRAELVRLSTGLSTAGNIVANPATVGGYPVYQMVSPPVPGPPHHSPVGMSQHAQGMRREVVESGRSSSHSMDSKR